MLHQGDYTSIQERIKTGAVDFGFVNPKAVTSLETLVLKEGAMLAAVPLELLAKELFILLEEGRYYEPLEGFRAPGVTPKVKYTHPRQLWYYDHGRGGAGRQHPGGTDPAPDELPPGFAAHDPGGKSDHCRGVLGLEQPDDCQQIFH